MHTGLILILSCTAAITLSLGRHQRIAGGDIVDINDYPYTVAILSNGNYFCGGSLISPKHVLTTARCTYWIDAVNLTVRVGSSLWREGGQVLNVSSSVYHPDYVDYLNDYDVAVLELENVVNDTSASIIALADADYKLDESSSVILTGWGSNFNRSEKVFTVPVLKMVETPVVPREHCSKLYYNLVNERMFCSGGVKGNGACDGDIGGPAVVDELLMGLVSWSQGYCGLEDYPTVFTYIPAVRDWIKNNTGV